RQGTLTLFVNDVEVNRIQLDRSGIYRGQFKTTFTAPAAGDYTVRAVFQPIDQPNSAVEATTALQVLPPAGVRVDSHVFWDRRSTFFIPGRNGEHLPGGHLQIWYRFTPQPDYAPNWVVPVVDGVAH